MNVQSLLQLGAVGLHGFYADPEVEGDFPSAIAFGDEHKDFALPRREFLRGDRFRYASQAKARQCARSLDFEGTGQTHQAKQPLAQRQPRTIKKMSQFVNRGEQDCVPTARVAGELLIFTARSNPGHFVWGLPDGIEHQPDYLSGGYPVAARLGILRRQAFNPSAMAGFLLLRSIARFATFFSPLRRLQEPGSLVLRHSQGQELSWWSGGY